MPASFDSSWLDYPAPTAPLGTEGFIIECWLYTDDITPAGHSQFIVHLDTATPSTDVFGNAQLGWIGNNGDGSFGVSVGSGHQTVHSTAGVITAGRWIHLAVYCDNNPSNLGIWLYADGVAAGNTSGASAAATMDGGITIGGMSGRVDRGLKDARVHRVRVYSTTGVSRAAFESALTAAVADPMGSSDLATVLASSLRFQAELNSTLDGSSGTPTPHNNSGSDPTLTRRYPGDIPGLALWADFDSPDNTTEHINETSGLPDSNPDQYRFTQATDQSGHGNHLVNATHDGFLVGTQPWSGGKTCGVTPDNGSGAYRSKFMSCTTLANNSRAVSAVVFGCQSHVQRFDDFGFIVDLGSPTGTECLGLTTDGAGASAPYPGATGIMQASAAGSLLTLSSSYSPLCPCSVRMLGIAASASATTVFQDLTVGSWGAPTADTTAGIVVGGECTSGTRSKFFSGIYHEVLVYQRTLGPTDYLLLDDYGRRTYGYKRATSALIFKGSSTLAGYPSVHHDDKSITYRLGRLLPDVLILNQSDTGSKVTTWLAINSLDTVTEVVDNLYQLPFSIVVGAYHNDDTDFPTHNPPYWSNDLAGVKADYTTFFDLLDDYGGGIYVMQMQPRGDFAGHDTVTAAQERLGYEANSTLFHLWASGLNNIAGVIDRPPALRLGAGYGDAEIVAMTSSSYYIASDYVHLDNSGQELWARQLAGFFSGARAGSLLLLD